VHEGEAVRLVALAFGGSTAASASRMVAVIISALIGSSQ
jgi:hypothetical protein